MNQKNLDYLKENLKYMGFGEKLYPELEKNIQQGFPEFKLSIQNEYGKDKLSADLHFRRSDQGDMYFFNRYDAKLTNEVANMSQSFYLNKGIGITLKEAYNLMEGRSVNKELVTSEGQRYNAWVQLDFKDKDQNDNFKMKQFHQNYGYDLHAALNKLPIRELSNEQQKEMLVRSLQRGNLQSVTFEKDGKQNKMFIEANPQFKSVNVYDASMNKVIKDVLQKPAAEKSESKEVKSGQNQEARVSKDEPLLKKNDKQNKPDSLLPKKRTSNKKGLSL